MGTGEEGVDISSVSELPRADPSRWVHSLEVSFPLGAASRPFLPPSLPPSDPKPVSSPPPLPCPTALHTGGGGCDTTAEKSPPSESTRRESWGKKRAIWFSEPRPGWVSSERPEASSRGPRQGEAAVSGPTRGASASAPYWPAGAGGGSGRSPAHSRARLPGAVPELGSESSPRSCSAPRLPIGAATTCSEQRPGKAGGAGRRKRRREEETGRLHAPSSPPLRAAPSAAAAAAIPAAAIAASTAATCGDRPDPLPPVATPGCFFLAPAFYAHCHSRQRYYYSKKRDLADRAKRTTHTSPNCSSVSREERVAFGGRSSQGGQGRVLKGARRSWPPRGGKLRAAQTRRCSAHRPGGGVSARSGCPLRPDPRVRGQRGVGNDAPSRSCGADSVGDSRGGGGGGGIWHRRRPPPAVWSSAS